MAVLFLILKRRVITLITGTTVFGIELNSTPSYDEWFLGSSVVNGNTSFDGVGTDFDNTFSVGNILGIHSPSNSNLIGGFAYYEILTIKERVEKLSIIIGCNI